MTTANQPTRTIRAWPGHPCPRCRRRHRDWWGLAHCIWPKAAWVAGDEVPRQGPCYAVLANCGALTITLWPTLEKALDRKTVIDSTGCGGRCSQVHEVVLIAKED
jgi:hypothetical protein